MSGKLITIEGTDGAGKTTQIQLMIEYLEKKGCKVLLTREPGGTPISEKIRTLLLDENAKEMTAVTEALLYTAARAQHFQEKIWPAVQAGQIVICDRFIDSSIAYQGYGRRLTPTYIKQLNELAIGSIQPDLTLFLDLNPALGISRKKKDTALDRMEQEKLEFHQRVYDGYIALCEANPGRIQRIDASGEISSIHKAIVQALERLLEME